MSRSFPVFPLCLAASLLCGCQIAATVDATPEITDGGEVAFGTIEGVGPDGGAPGGGASFGDRHGSVNPWTDTLSTEPSRTTGLKKLGQLETTEGNGPDIVLAGVGIYTSFARGTTIAIDLATQKLIWTATVRLGAGQMTTNGTLVCGVVYGVSALACLDVATGAKKWQVTTALQIGNATGPQLELDLRDGRLTIYDGGYQHWAAAFDTATGTLLWTRTNVPQGRALVFVGNDLVLGSSAVDPATGVDKATTTHQGLGYLWQKNGKGYFQADTGAAAVSYDPATHLWADATAELATFLAGFQTNNHVPYPIAFALTTVAADGTLYGLVSGSAPPHAAVLCQWNATTQATAWCVDGNGLGDLRVHPNRLYHNGIVRNAATGAILSTEMFSLFFGQFAFNGTTIYGVN